MFLPIFYIYQVAILLLFGFYLKSAKNVSAETKNEKSKNDFHNFENLQDGMIFIENQEIVYVNKFIQNVFQTNTDEKYENKMIFGEFIKNDHKYGAINMTLKDILRQPDSMQKLFYVK